MGRLDPLKVMKKDRGHRGQTAQDGEAWWWGERAARRGEAMTIVNNDNQLQPLCSGGAASVAAHDPV